MDKLKDLFKKIGASDELVEAVVKELDDYRKTVSEELQAEFKTRLDKARKLCLEETESYKRQLAKKLAIFVESKQAQIARAVEKQLAVEGSQAVDKLSQVKAVLEGIEPAKIGEVPADLAKISEELDSLRKTNTKLAEEREAAIRKAQRANEIASKVLKQNRVLEGKIDELSSQLSESHKDGKKTVAEDKKPKIGDDKEKIIAENKQRLSDLRKSKAQPRSTTRPKTLTESGGDSDDPIAKIAEVIE